MKDQVAQKIIYANAMAKLAKSKWALCPHSKVPPDVLDAAKAGQPIRDPTNVELSSLFGLVVARGPNGPRNGGRNEQMRINITLEEKETLRQAAGMANRSDATFVREAAMREALRVLQGGGRG